jgi:cytochrome P450
MIKFDPYSMDFHNDPYPLYKQLRDEAPVYYQKDLNFYAISRYADVKEAHRDTERFSSAGGVTIEPMEGAAALIVKDDPEHRWHKALVTKVFTRGRMEALGPFVRKLCVELLESAREREEFDFVNDFAVELPLRVISELIGIPEEHRHAIHHFVNMILVRGNVDPMEIYKAKIASAETYAELISDRRKNPRDDVITLLMTTELEDDQGVVRFLTDDELADRFVELAAAGHETVSKAIPSGIAALQSFPDEHRKLLNDPSLIDKAVEEVLRFDPPSQLQGRTTTTDVTLHGVTIPAGSKTMLLTGSATRDERKFENADVFDVNRPLDLASVYFGYGVHRCLGVHLARLEIRIALEEILKRMPNLRVFPEQSTRMILSNVRGFASLPARANG